jgi:hypothetical protein
VLCVQPIIAEDAATNEDSDQFFENAVAIIPHFARGIAQEVQDASGKMSEPSLPKFKLT